MASTARSRAKYVALAHDTLELDNEDYSKYYEPQDDDPKVAVPLQSIALAVLLLALGILFFVFAWLHFTQRILGRAQAEIGFTVLGVITFVPGYYHCHIAFCAWRGYKGYTFDMIPEW